MTGHGPATSPAHGTLLVFGTGPGDPDDAEAPDHLAAAEAVFAGPPGSGPDPEATALFYAEAWRVERIDARDAASRLATWFDGRPGRTAALLVAGPVEDAVAFGAVLDGLARLRPGLRVDRRAGAAVTPPRRSPLTR
jgi:hypothetical protein